MLGFAFLLAARIQLVLLLTGGAALKNGAAKDSNRTSHFADLVGSTLMGHLLLIVTLGKPAHVACHPENRIDNLGPQGRDPAD